MRKYVCRFIYCLVITACATYPTYPPPYFEDTRYFDPEFELRFEIPKGWVPSQNAPPWIDNNWMVENAAAIRAIFVNTDSNGVIFVKSNKNFLRINDINWDKIVREVKNNFEKQKSEYLKSGPFAKAYSYHVYEPYKAVYNPGFFISPTLMYDKKIISENKGYVLRSKALGFAYKSSEDTIYVVEAELISDIHNLYFNRRAFTRLVDSLNAYLNRARVD